MKLCTKSGVGVCVDCDCNITLKQNHCDICQKDVPLMLDFLKVLLETTLTGEQTDVVSDFEFKKEPQYLTEIFGKILTEGEIEE